MVIPIGLICFTLHCLLLHDKRSNMYQYYIYSESMIDYSFVKLGILGSEPRPTLSLASDSWPMLYVIAIDCTRIEQVRVSHKMKMLAQCNAVQ